MKENLEFNSKNEELEYYKSKNETLEKKITTLDSKIKNLEAANEKLKNCLSVFGSNSNNTSVQYLLPSEFKRLWENLIRIYLLDGFNSFCEDPIFASNITQDLFLITYKEANELINKKIDTIIKAFNIKTIEDKKKITFDFVPFFQEYFFEIFALTEDIIQNIQSELLAVAKTYKFKFSMDCLKEDLKEGGFKVLINSLFKICMYMTLHEPKLTINIKPYAKRKLVYTYFDNKEMYLAGGFLGEKKACIIVLPPPLLRQQFPFVGIRAAVFALSKVDNFIISECEKNKKNLQSKSTSGTPVSNKIMDPILDVGISEGSKSSQKDTSRPNDKFSLKKDLKDELEKENNDDTKAQPYSCLNDAFINIEESFKKSNEAKKEIPKPYQKLPPSKPPSDAIPEESNKDGLLLPTKQNQKEMKLFSGTLQESFNKELDRFMSNTHIWKGGPESKRAHLWTPSGLNSFHNEIDISQYQRSSYKPYMSKERNTPKTPTNRNLLEYNSKKNENESSYSYRKSFSKRYVMSNAYAENELEMNELKLKYHIGEDENVYFGKDEYNITGSNYLYNVKTNQNPTNSMQYESPSIQQYKADRYYLKKIPR